MSKKTECFFYGFLGFSILFIYAAPFVGLSASILWKKILFPVAPLTQEYSLEKQNFDTASSFLPKNLQPNLHVLTTKELTHVFKQHGFSVEKARGEKEVVPKLYLAHLPKDLKKISSPNARKKVFLETLLPIIVEINQNILNVRQQIASLQEEVAKGHTLTPEERTWLSLLCAEYKIKQVDIDALLARVDVVPISLALAQGILESGWGTSKLAQNSNSLFGHTLPNNKVKKTDYKVFDNLVHTVEAYVKNLNTHPAYKPFRSERAQLRGAGKPLDAHHLAGGLKAYSELGMTYVQKLRKIMKSYALYDFDTHLVQIEQEA